MHKIIPIFYACDDNFVKYTIVSLTSLISNASKEFLYKIHVLNTNISKEMKEELVKLENDNFTIEFNNVSKYIKSISQKLPIRDYYSKTTYFRMFIAEMFKEYDKVIYIDSDTIVLGDISELYRIDLHDNLLGACHEQVMIQEEIFGNYVEKCVGVNRSNFFNAGLLVINSVKFREYKILDNFNKLLLKYNFVVTQDEDYLNVLCQNKVFWIDQVWNLEVYGEIPYEDDEIKMIHYIMVSKPWRFIDCRYSGYFWKYAKLTSVYNLILRDLSNYTEEDKKKDLASCENLKELAIKESNRSDNYANIISSKKAKDRLEVLEKIKELERLKKFDIDVENDPPSTPLFPDKVDYTRRKIISKIKTRIAFLSARIFLNKIIKDKKLIIKEVIGIENLKELNTGAIITCNHFNAFDSFIMHIIYDLSKQKKRKLYRVIREGNYTNFPGFYGFLMRNCNTLPLSSNNETMKLFIKSVDQLLKDSNFILIYPEQSMWWNYKKPKPLKTGAFNFAVRANVPVVPCFITMENSNKIGEDGFYIQEHTVHIGKPIYPKKDLSKKDNIDFLLNENYKVWKEIYEKFYNISLEYND